eukprot:6479072-Amphidinium_carterae.1
MGEGASLEQDLFEVSQGLLEIKGWSLVGFCPSNGCVLAMPKNNITQKLWVASLIELPKGVREVSGVRVL